MINYGGCWLVLLLEQADAKSLFDWSPTDNDLEFELEYGGPNFFEHNVKGPPPDAPKTIQAGRWAVGLGLGESSDVVGTPNWGTVLCVREFDVTEEMHSVTIAADFDYPCRIDIEFDPEPAATVTEIPVRLWTPPPEGGLMDDCRDRRVQVRVDADGTPWYEDIDTGQRIDIARPDFVGWTVVRRGQDVKLVAPHGDSIPELYVTGVTCVFEAGDMAWIGGPDVVWEPWDRALGSDAAYAARLLLESGRGHMGGLPPAAATLSSPLTLDLDQADLQTLDEEIGVSGAAWWSTSVPGVFIGNPNAIALEIAPDTRGSGIVADDPNWQWIDRPGPGGYAGGADGWSSQRVRLIVTPGGKTVWLVGERLTVWENCSKAVVPEARTGGVDAIDSGIDVAGGIVDARIFGEGGSHIQVVADFRDDACRSHGVIGPIIDHLLSDQVPPVSPIPTPLPRFDAIGRLKAGPERGQCLVLVGGDGTTWEMRLPLEYFLHFDGSLKLIDSIGREIAAEGDTLAVTAELDPSGVGGCGGGPTLQVTRMVFVDRVDQVPTASTTPSPVVPTCAGTMLPALVDEHEDVVVALIDRLAGLLTITVTSDYETRDRITVRYDDATCLSDPLVGPIIRGAVHGFGARQSEHEDRVGRLVVTNAEAGCSALLQSEGWTMNLVWPSGFEVGASGVVQNGQIVARPGDLVRVQGTERREVPGACVDDWTLTVNDVTVLEPAASP